MPIFSADMDFTWFGLKLGGAKRHERDFELLQRKMEYLYDVRDSVREEKVKELMLGTVQTRECKKWLNKEREIEGRLDDLLRFNKESSGGGVKYSCMKVPHEDLMTALDEVTYHLENSPMGDGSMACAPHRATKTLASLRIGARTSELVDKNNYVNQKRKTETKNESNLVHTQGKEAARRKEIPHGKSVPSLDEGTSVLAHEMSPGYMEPEAVVLKSVQYSSMAQSPDRGTEKVTSPRIGSKTYGQIEKTMIAKQRMKVDTKVEEARSLWKKDQREKQKDKLATPQDARSSVLAHEKNQRLEAFNFDVMSVAQSSATFGRKDKMTYALSDDSEVLDEFIHTPFTTSQPDADQVSVSTTETVAEDKMIFLSQTDTRPMKEYETQHTSETEGKLPLQVAGIVETSTDGNKRMLPIHEREFKTVPSLAEGERKIDVKQSVEPAYPVATSKEGPSDTTVAEPVTASPFRKKDKILAMTKAETENLFKSKGDEWLLGSNLDVKSSINRTVLKIFRCMNDVNARKIGVHGIGGIGKTSVLKALINYPKTKGIFDSIILVSVSRYWSIKNIQNELLRQLSLSREDSETDSQVAEKLFQVLSGKKFLLLLDDVWERIDIEAVGIPDPISGNGCKIVMTSRELNVCYDMDVIRVIEVEIMSKEEACELFSEQVGKVSDSPDIQPFVHAIVKGCGGVPLLTIVTGRALTEENNVTVWEHASRKFQLTGTATTYNTEDIIQLLKFSFDQLIDYDMKSCFLYCCLFSEVKIFEFIEHCIQEGLIDERRAGAHKRGLAIVNLLVRAFLVEITEGGDTIKMHDLIRDLALGILSSAAEGRQYLLGAYSRLREPLISGSSLSLRSLESPNNISLLIPEGPDQFLLRAGAGLTEPPLEEWKRAKMIFLMDNNLCTLPERPNCPDLLTLFLQRNYQLRVIPSSFFDFMTSLKVLNLSKTRVKSLPKALFQLKELQILILRHCERLFMLPSEVGCLECLEVLDLQGTEISKLPDEIGKLASLRHLEVSFYGSIDYSEYIKLPRELISTGIISRLHALETLSIVVHPGDQRWYENVKSVITEISNLMELSSLSFHFPQVEILELFLQKSIVWNAQRLTEFKFVVGQEVKSITSRVPNYVEFDYSQQGQCLRYVNGEKMPDAVLKILSHSSAFFLDHHLDICSLSNFGVNNINELKLCIISECPKIEKVVDSKELTTTVFPCLEYLSIHHLWNLKCIWEGIVPKGSFAGLKLLSVCACPKLKYVFRSSMIQFVPKLEELAIEDCPAIEEILLEGEITDSGGIMLPSLKKLTLHYLPGLVNIWKSAWPALEHISFYNCPKLKNIGMDSRSKQTIREIKAEKSWWDELEWEDTALQLHLQNRLFIIHEDDL
ncbi:hypothetical protein Dsin_018337 [Dipteronia sinensis]|uniref:AAA+ ATPase domain-containing protein n=1 Tax=Dipteronia sinensis TaxID=43782 RepID=A0AAE0A5A8_9ROSI|nr:hypothetical protein Dsin_018337 [Dipteronia sinensis]